MDENVKSLLAAGAQLTDEALERLLAGPETLPHSIHRAMRHSTFAGGKRLRPILCMETAKMVAAKDFYPPETAAPVRHPEGIANLGAAIEMLHTYSLIHDDLPALDNDDLAAASPTCHIVFGEATAILAGDALQTLAFQTIAELPAPPHTIVSILREVAIAVGTGVGCVGDIDTPLAPGMIGGQVMDIESEGEKPTAALVEAIHRAKTGALITVSIIAGAIYGSYRHAMPGSTLARVREFGQKAGLAFQIVDDILDITQSSEQLGKTAGKDTATDKATWPAVFGIERSRHDAAELIADAFQALAPFGEDAAPLKSLARYLVDRKN